MPLRHAAVRGSQARVQETRAARTLRDVAGPGRWGLGDQRAGARCRRLLFFQRRRPDGQWRRVQRPGADRRPVRAGGGSLDEQHDCHRRGRDEPLVERLDGSGLRDAGAAGPGDLRNARARPDHPPVVRGSTGTRRDLRRPDRVGGQRHGHRPHQEPWSDDGGDHASGRVLQRGWRVQLGVRSGVLLRSGSVLRARAARRLAVLRVQAAGQRAAPPRPGRGSRCRVQPRRLAEHLHPSR